MTVNTALCCVGMFAAATCAFGQGGGIQGVVSDESGQLLSGAYVIATPTRPGATLLAVSPSGGKYSFAQVPAGTYTICVQIPSGTYQGPSPGPASDQRPPIPFPSPAPNYLDSCYWSDPTKVTVNAGQVATNVNVRVAKGAVVHVRLNDTGQYMTRGVGAVLVGVVGPYSRWIPLKVISSDPSGRNLELAIPFNTALRLEVNGGGLQLADEAGVALPALGKSFSILQAVAQKDPTLTFNITGKRP